MNVHLPLAVGFGEIVTLLFLVISFIVWVVNQANAQKIKNLNQKQKQPQPPRGQNPGQLPGGQLQGQQRGPQGPLGQGQRPGQAFGGQGMGPAAQQQARRPQDPELAIEEFLRRAAQQQVGQQQPQRPMASRQPAPVQQLAKQAVDWNEDQAAFGKDVASYEQTRGVVAHVRETMDPSRFGKSDLTDLDEVDNQLKARLQATFDHQVGTLTSSPDSVAAPAPATSVAATVSRRNVSAAAAGVAAMLADRRNLANAIILQEIFRRPEV